jgi:hypothetical protein
VKIVWEDWMMRYDAAVRDYDGKLTQYEMNKKPKVKFYGVDCGCDKRFYKVNDKIIAIPVGMNKESLYKKSEYVQKNYPWLDEEEFEAVVHYLNIEVIIEEKPVAEWHEIPKKELTPDEKFEELKNNIRKKNEIKRKTKRTVRGWLIKHDNIVNFISFVLAMVTVFVPILLFFQFGFWIGGLM